MVHLSFSFSLIVGDGAPVANAVVLSVVVAAAAGEGGDADEDHMKKWAHETGSVWCIRNEVGEEARAIGNRGPPKTHRR
jgi:hypothetical protein